MSANFHQLLPLDQHNRELESNVRPPDWTNPHPGSDYHLVVMGAGTAGLVTAAGAAGLGARVALIERELMGGDCLNVGCVPSKGIISAARAVAEARNASSFGVHSRSEIVIDFGQAMEQMRANRARISPVDSAHRFQEMGVDVYFGRGSFVNSNTIAVTTQDNSTTNLNFRKAVIATGARAAAPPIEGLDSVPYLTNESLFSLTELPGRLGVVGGGPIGCEIAQSFARFGSHVSLFETNDHVLSREDDDAARVLQSRLELDGVQLVLNSQDMRLSPTDEGIRIQGKQGSARSSYDVTVDRLLVAVGRAPNTDDLNLGSVNVNFDQHGVTVDDYMRTTNPKIYAAGDICSKLKFTHAADFQARIVIQNALFAVGPFGRKKASRLVIPWATYTSPEIAHIGIHPKEAAEQGIGIDTYTQSFEHVDRAILERDDAGFVKVHTQKGTDRILGATIVAKNAGDLISEVAVAMTHRLGLSKLGSTIHPYPTHAEAIRRLGDQYNKTKLTPFSQRVLAWLMRWNVGT